MARTSPTPGPTKASEPADLSRLVGVKLGNYRLERILGRGRMGVVYLAKDEALLRPTAIKILSWSVEEAKGLDPVAWFLAEARMVARINHPRVVQIYGAARHDDHCYIAMEYVPGASAETVISRGGPMSPEAATDILMQAAAALHAAHRSGVIHRDVKPANLLVGENGVAKLGDFGMAFGTDVRGAHAQMRVGTPYYTAPEIWRGEGATTASDIYSLGATYYQLLTGKPPHGGPDVAAVQQAHLRAPVPDPRLIVPTLPSSCAALVRRALAKSPRERHSSAQELVWDARRVLQDLTSPASAAARPRRARVTSCLDSRTASLPPSAGEPFAKHFGLVRRPFTDVDPTDCPYLGEPFASAHGRVVAWLGDPALTVLGLTGGMGSGRSTLSRRVALEAAKSRLALYADAGEAGTRTLLQRLCREAGLLDDPSDETNLDALVDRLGEERRQGRDPALVVLDNTLTTNPATSGVTSLLCAAVWTRSFKVLLTGPAGLIETLEQGGVDFQGSSAPELSLPPLDRKQIEMYLRAWLRDSRRPNAPGVVLSADAVLLLELRSGGALKHVNCIAENMLVLAAAEGRRSLTSWHAWTASDKERWAQGQSYETLPGRPATWPPSSVIEVIDACRRKAGIPPWPTRSEV